MIGLLDLINSLSSENFYLATHKTVLFNDHLNQYRQNCHYFEGFEIGISNYYVHCVNKFTTTVITMILLITH